MKAPEIITKLRKQGITKYQIAKECGVKWQTVHMWEKGVFEPREKHRERLQKLASKEFFK